MGKSIIESLAISLHMHNALCITETCFYKAQESFKKDCWLLVPSDSLMTTRIRFSWQYAFKIYFPVWTIKVYQIHGTLQKQQLSLLWSSHSGEQKILYPLFVFSATLHRKST